MLNYETLLSSYDDKLTLMQWLKKVEEALKDASAIAFKVNQRGNATLTFSVEFEDGTELETGPIVLQQGESVVSAAIVGGHLKLTLSNGDVLDAGDLGGVSSFSIDASQHLIVNYQNGTTQDLGAIFSGNVNIAGNFTANSIIENMTGYGFTKISGATAYTLDYVGVVKNGNKLTFAIAGKCRVDSATSRVDLGYFSLPSSAIGDKLYPIDTYNNLSYSKVSFYSDYTNKVDADIVLSKVSTVTIFIKTYLDNLVPNTDYYFRYEVTFLLSENLAA